MPRIDISELKPKIWSKDELDRINSLSDEELAEAIECEAFLPAYSTADMAEAEKSGDVALVARMRRVIKATKARHEPTPRSLPLRGKS